MKFLNEIWFEKHTYQTVEKQVLLQHIIYA